MTITWLKDNYPIITNINSGSVILPPTQSSSASSGNANANNGYIKIHHHQQPHEVNTHHHHMYLMSTSLVGHNHHTSSNGHGQQLGEQNTSPHATHTHNLRLTIRQLDHFSSVLSIPSLEPHHSGKYINIVT